MPTLASHPTLEITQAVGAVLLHQFARQRFIEAGVGEELIRDAEEKENMSKLAAVLLQEESGDNSDTTRDTSSFMNETNSTHNDTTATIQNSFNRSNNSDADDQYASVAESVNGNNDTVYHSINGGRHEAPSLDRLQSLPTMALCGRELRKVAEEFERTRLRDVVKNRANSVQLNDINRDNFIQLMEELFQGGITRERIVILFFFCTDVALRAASFGQELVVQFMRWSFSYIINTVCKIVHALGGWQIELGCLNEKWDNIMFRQLPSVLISCCAALGILALVTHLNKSLRAT